ncbi:MAG: FAD-dependent oxidoreductase [Burkholderiaceae bacterium]|nr:FAD-dependent oxidoreductase [Burkholderiaceae bacterium]
MATHFDFVVIGGGVAGATAAETLRAEGAEGSILLLAAEPHPPYKRASLSMAFLSEAQAPEPQWALPAGAYGALDIDLRLGTRVARLDTTERLLWTDCGECVHFGQLLIATGSRALQLDLPGATLDGIHGLRSLADAQGLRADLQTARRAVVIGGSFTGLEVAASLRQRGLEVTLIERAGLLDALHRPDIAAFFEGVLKAQGVRVLTGDAPRAFDGTERVTAVHTVGGHTLPCDLVVLGIGVAPDTGFLEGSGLATDEGIVVDRFLQTAVPGIFAAGDVASFFDPVFQRQRRIGHWDNAVKQGRLAARNMRGQHLPYAEVSYFDCHVFEHSFNLLGLIEPGLETVDRGSLASGSFASFYLQDGVPRALFSLGRPSQETRVTETLIQHRVNLQAHRAQLADPQAPLDPIPNQTIFILQGGGALGAFECGVVKALSEGGIRPDIVAGVSIGAFNSALIASNPDRAVEALEAFWQELATGSPDLPDEPLRRALAQGMVAMFGVQQFFQPRWFQPMLDLQQLPMHWTSLYDTTPIKQLLKKYIDFDRLASSPVRLLVSAVDVETSELVVFDSYVDRLTPEHILASGSLPPSFPWTTINGRHYWDGGIVSNSPLEQVVARCGSAGKRVFIIDLFPGQRRTLPQNLAEVMARRDEILYSERIRSDVQTRGVVHGFQQLVEDVMAELPPEAATRLRHSPRFIQQMGNEAPMHITRIVRGGSEDEAPSSDYDFSARTVEQLALSGYRMARQALGLPEATDPPATAPPSA